MKSSWIDRGLVLTAVALLAATVDCRAGLAEGPPATPGASTAPAPSAPKAEQPAETPATSSEPASVPIPSTKPASDSGSPIVSGIAPKDSIAPEESVRQRALVPHDDFDLLVPLASPADSSCPHCRRPLRIRIPDASTPVIGARASHPLGGATTIFHRSRQANALEAGVAGEGAELIPGEPAEVLLRVLEEMGAPGVGRPEELGDLATEASEPSRPSTSRETFIRTLRQLAAARELRQQERLAAGIGAGRGARHAAPAASGGKFEALRRASRALTAAANDLEESGLYIEADELHARASAMREQSRKIRNDPAAGAEMAQKVAPGR